MTVVAEAQILALRAQVEAFRAGDLQIEPLREAIIGTMAGDVIIDVLGHA